jgi:nitroreductase
MELADVVRRRRMVRRFLDRPVPDEALHRILATALQGPSAGFAQGTDLLVLQGVDVARYWEVTLPPARRAAFPWPGLLMAPVIVVPVADPAAYVARYREPDKAVGGLGESADAWPVPYWLLDTAMAAMLALLATVDEDLGALFFGLFEHEDAVKEAFGVPGDRRPIGAIAIGYPDPDDRPSRSAARPRRPITDAVHRGRW